MKRITVFSKLAAFTTIVLIAVSCTQEPDLGDIDYQERYAGRWSCEEKTGINAPQFYDVQIEMGTDPTEIVIKNLYNSPTSISANIAELNFSIPTQASNSITFTGTGKANADFEQIVLNFTANDGSAEDKVQAVLRPKN